MNWTEFLIPAAVVIAIVLLKKRGQISSAEALKLLRSNALVIDVRSRAEFNSGHLPRAINIPLDEIGSAAAKLLPDKKQALLLHCASGMRSGIARGKLTGMGYTQVFNLGSYGRAESIVSRPG